LVPGKGPFSSVAMTKLYKTASKVGKILDALDRGEHVAYSGEFKHHTELGINRACAVRLSSTFLVYAGKSIVGEYDENVDYCEGLDMSVLPKAGRPFLHVRMKMYSDMITDLSEALIPLRMEYILGGDQSAETRSLLSKMSLSVLGLQLRALDHKWAAAVTE